MNATKSGKLFVGLALAVLWPAIGAKADDVIDVDNIVDSSDVAVYYESPIDSATVCAWMWNLTTNDGGIYSERGQWPGDEFTRLGKVANGNALYRLAVDKAAGQQRPDRIIITENGTDDAHKVVDTAPFVNHGYYVKGQGTAVKIVASSGDDSGISEQYLVDDGVAVFYPDSFDATQHLPSPIFVSEPTKTADMPGQWTLRPVFTVENGHSIARITVGDDVDLYGTGEVYGPLRRNGETTIFWNKDNYGYNTDNGRRLYQSHPFVLGVRPDGTAFGIIADNTWKSSVTTSAMITFDSYGPPFRLFIIERQSPQDVLKELGKLSGTMPMPPLWALGYQQSRYSYHPQSQVREIADRLRADSIPCDVIWMDIDYMDHYKIFTFNASEFPDPKGLHDYLNGIGFKTVYMIDPAPKKESGYSVWDEGEAGGYWVKDKDGNSYTGTVWPGECNFPDFSRPDVRQWWAGLYADFLEQGVDGVWNDMNEPAVFGGPDGSMPEDNIHQGGDGLAEGPHLRYHNRYGYDMVLATRAGMEQARPDERPFVLSRSNFLGGQRYATTWTGDNTSSDDHMRHSIPMTLNMGLSAQAMNGPDLGGYTGTCSGELLATWTAFGVYFPFVRNHSGDAQEPWIFGTEVENVCRTAINRRYRLMPYIYTAVHDASATGLPIMQPVFMADTKDLSLRGEEEAFMLGNDLIIVPAWATDVSLPSEQWNRLAFEETADNWQATVRQRPGSIVPMVNLVQSTDFINTDSLTLLVNYDNGSATGTMYEDDGHTLAYKNGDYAVLTFTASGTPSDPKVTIEKTGGNRDVSAKVIRIGVVSDNAVRYLPWGRVAVTDAVANAKAAESHPFVRVYSIDGRVVWSGPEDQIAAARTNKGLYIVKGDNFVRKVVWQ